MSKILASGAEAVLSREDNIVVKTRIPKQYRHPELDAKLRKSRTRREAKVIEKLAQAGVAVPQLVSFDDKAMTVTMSYVDGRPLQEVFAEKPEYFAGEIGRIIATLHSHEIIHGDLTTSNLVFAGKLHLIDFGLSFFSQKAEDRATDLHVLLQGLKALHKNDCCSLILQSYKENFSGAEEVLKRLENVESRGRNKRK